MGTYRKGPQTLHLPVRNLRSGRRGRRFKSCHSDQTSRISQVQPPMKPPMNGGGALLPTVSVDILRY
jgi:hypothetical protein